MSALIIKDIEESIEKAVEIINNDGVVILPADTVYGLFAKATSKSAVERVYEVKKRERRKPFVIYTNKDKVSDICQMNDTSKKLVEEIWPQALSLILPKKDIIENWFTQDRPTVAVMTAQNALISEVIKRVNAPVLGTTVNISGEPEMKKFTEVEIFKEQVDLIYDNDQLIIYNKPSTMVDCTISPPKVARLSSLSVEQLQNTIPEIDLGLERRIK